MTIRSSAEDIGLVDIQNEHEAPPPNEESNSEGLTQKAFQITHNMIQFIGNVCPYAKPVTEWAKNSYSYVFDGSIPSLFKVMRIGNTLTYEPYKVVPIAHKPYCMVITDPKYIEPILTQLRDGKIWSGGADFAPVGYVTGETNPLTEKNQAKQHCLKAYAMTQHFGYNCMRGRSIEFLQLAEKFVSEGFDANDDYDTFNATQIILDYTVDISMKVILGMKGDRKVLGETISCLEQLATDMILYKPNALIPNYFIKKRGESQELLKRTVEHVIDQDKNPDSITQKMIKEARYNETQVKKIRELKGAFSSQLKKTPQEYLETLHKFMTTHTYAADFFELAEKYSYDIPHLEQLAEVKKKDINTIDPTYFQHIEENGEIAAFIDIISLMIAGKDEQKFDQNQVADMVKTVLIIGSGTTRSSIISTLYCLMKNPEEQERLYNALKDLDLDIPSEEEVEELDKLTLETLQQRDLAALLDVSLEDVSKEKEYEEYCQIRDIPLEELTQEQFTIIKEMKIKSINNKSHRLLMKCQELDNVINEVMRMYPPIAVQSRLAKKDVDIHDLHIPEGWTVFLANIISYNDESRWDNPEAFQPDRFNDKKKLMQQIHPFNLGKNQCMGRFQALTSIKSLLYFLVTKYKILPPVDIDDNEIDQQFILSAGIALKFDKDLLIRLEKR